jgi:hypothetical protein
VASISAHLPSFLKLTASEYRRVSNWPGLVPAKVMDEAVRFSVSSCLGVHASTAGGVLDGSIGYALGDWSVESGGRPRAGAPLGRDFGGLTWVASSKAEAGDGVNPSSIDIKMIISVTLLTCAREVIPR